MLTQVGIFADVVPSEVEEKITKTLPAEVVEELSRQKCLDVAGRMAEDCMVLGADTVVAAEGRILGKPGTLKRAEEMLQRLQGRTHQVYTGVTLAEVKAGRIVRAETFSSCTSVTVCPMTDEEIAEYAVRENLLTKRAPMEYRVFLQSLWRKLKVIIIMSSAFRWRPSISA